MTSRGPEPDLAGNATLEEALSRGLELPLSALRASLESLGRSLPEKGPQDEMLHAILGEVQRLGRNVRELMEYASAPEPMPMRCTAIEIARSALNGLAKEDVTRVAIARVESEGSLRTDAPLLSKAVRRMLENALAAGSEDVLLVLRSGRTETTFSIVNADPTSGSDTRRDAIVTPFESKKRARLGLGLALTERDVALIGGRVERGAATSSGAVVRIVSPNEVDGSLTPNE